MSQFPPPNDPLSYASPSRKARPTSVTVIAILAIIFASLVVLGTLCSLPQYLGVKFSPNPVIDRVRDDSFLLAVSISSMVIGFALAVVELYGGIGLLSLRRSARSLMIGYAWTKLVISIIEIGFTFLLVNPRMEKLIASAVSGGFSPQMQSMMKMGMYAGTIAAIVFLVWPILILYYLKRPHVEAAFTSGADPRAGEYYQP
jgi:hypothetical protein